MHYHEAANFLFDLRRFSVKPGTERVEALLDRLDRPDAAVPCVQITGSNGKGSTARMTESVLREAGYSVGLYTSPHLSSLTERVQVDGRSMTESAVAAFVERVSPWLIEQAAEGEPLTFFEVVTAMALHEFARRDVDVAVLEVGLGGEYDATSAVDPVATAVTNVSLEHTAVLGDSVAEIARTKARIAAPDAPMVTACTGEALAVVRAVAAAADAPVTTVAGPGRDRDSNGNDDSGDNSNSGEGGPAIVAHYEGRVSRTDSHVRFDGASAGTYRIPLVGEHQATNAAIAAALADRTCRVLEDDSGDDETGVGERGVGAGDVAGAIRARPDRPAHDPRRRTQSGGLCDAVGDARRVRLRRTPPRVRRDARQRPRRDGRSPTVGGIGDHVSAGTRPRRGPGRIGRRAS